MKSYHYDGLYRSTFTNQLPFGKDIVEGAYREGYDWAYKMREKYNTPKAYLNEWLADNSTMIVIPEHEYRETITTQDWEDCLPSEETMTLLDALRNGSPRPYNRNGRPDDIGQFDTGKLASDIEDAIWAGAYDGYIDTCYEAAGSLGVELVEADNQ